MERKRFLYVLVLGISAILAGCDKNPSPTAPSTDILDRPAPAPDQFGRLANAQLWLGNPRCEGSGCNPPARPSPPITLIQALATNPIPVNRYTGLAHNSNYTLFVTIAHHDRRDRGFEIEFKPGFPGPNSRNRAQSKNSANLFEVDYAFNARRGDMVLDVILREYDISQNPQTWDKVIQTNHARIIFSVQ